MAHRRRINTEEKAKVVASVWGTEIIQFHATLGCLSVSTIFCLVKLSLILVQATKNGAEYICGRVTGFRQTEDNRAGILEPVCSTVFLRVNPSGRKKNLLSSLLRHKESTS